MSVVWLAGSFHWFPMRSYSENASCWLTPCVEVVMLQVLAMNRKLLAFWWRNGVMGEGGEEEGEGKQSVIVYNFFCYYQSYQFKDIVRMSCIGQCWACQALGNTHTIHLRYGSVFPFNMVWIPRWSFTSQYVPITGFGVLVLWDLHVPFFGQLTSQSCG